VDRRTDAHESTMSSPGGGSSYVVVIMGCDVTDEAHDAACDELCVADGAD